MSVATQLPLRRLQQYASFDAVKTPLPPLDRRAAREGSVTPFALALPADTRRRFSGLESQLHRRWYQPALADLMI